MSRAVAISADYGYLTPAETLIKSIAYHNHHLKIYLLNTNIPQEWFTNINQRFQPIGVSVVNAKINPELISAEAVSRSYMNNLIYGRLMIPDLVKEDRVLYLDADTIVTEKLTDLFNTDLGDNIIGAVEDYTMQGSFNSGVLLIDNAKLKQIDNFSHDMLIAGQQPHSNDDQSLLNDYFKGHWTRLDPRYNIQIGLDSTIFFNEPNAKAHFYHLLKNAKPRVIIHYSTADKPWNTFSSGRLREKWWQYRNLTMDEIVHHGILPTNHRHPKANFFIFVLSQDNHGLNELIQAFPDCDFHIASWTTMGNWLAMLSQYPNVHLYPQVIGPVLDKIIGKTNVYLDLNYGPKENQFIDRCARRGVPVLAFQDTASDNDNTDTRTVFNNDDLDGLMQKVKSLI